MPSLRRSIQGRSAQLRSSGRHISGVLASTSAGASRLVSEPRVVTATSMSPVLQAAATSRPAMPLKRVSLGALIRLPLEYPPAMFSWPDSSRMAQSFSIRLIWAVAAMKRRMWTSFGLPDPASLWTFQTTYTLREQRRRRISLSAPPASTLT